MTSCASLPRAEARASRHTAELARLVGTFRAEDKARLDRDRAEREQIKRNKGTITSKRDKDGKFRPED